MKIFQLTCLSVSFLLATISPSQAELAGVFPAGGGIITIAPTAGPIEVSGGIEFVPTQGTLTQGATAAPFQFFIPNSAAPENVTFGSLGNPVTIDGPVTLDVTASADATIDGWWGKGVVPTAFPITGGGLLPDGSDAPISPIAPVDPVDPANPVDPVDPGTGGGNDGPIDPRLIGVFPAEGGKLTITPTAGPTRVAGVELVPTRGTLTQGADASPFAFFIPNASAPKNVTIGSLGTGPIIDGPVTLDITVSADAILTGTWGDGVTPVAFAITGGNGVPVDPGTGGGGGNEVMDTPPLSQPSIDLALENLDPAVLESQLLVFFPEGGGPLTIMGTNGPVETLGIELVAEPGMLFQGDSAEPFQFFIENTDAPGNVTLGSLGVPAVIDAPITLDIFASADAVLSGQWGEGSLATFPAFAVPNVPEPNGHWLAMIGVLGLLSLRQVRKN